jgi:uncharacterized DUF497 family protein
MEFEWDPEKATANIQKHKVEFSEAATVFGDFFSATVPDPDHSTDERRYLTIGISARGRPLIVAYAQRGERIRLISARKLTRRERRDYEDTRK